MIDGDTIAAIVIAIIGSGFIQFIINRWDNKKNLAKKIDSLSEDFQEHKAVLARTHILRFADESRNGIDHSKEYFQQQILDIDTYNNYCETHPEFANGLTVMASEYIKEEYKKKYLN